MIFGRRAFFGYVLHPSGQVWWFANPPSRTELSRTELVSLGVEQWKELLLALFDRDARTGGANHPGEHRMGTRYQRV